jgi:outer membrane protein
MMRLGKIFILIGVAISFASEGMAQENGTRLTLKDALQRVYSANLQVMMANARLEQAIARIAQARAGLLPQVEGTVNGARQTTDLRYNGLNVPGLQPHQGPYNNFDARGRVTLALFDPASFERFQAAKKGSNQSGAALEKTREDALALVASLFIDAQRKQQTAALFKKLLDRDQMAYDLSQYNFNQGTGSDLDSNKSKTNLDQSKYFYNQAQLQAKEACLDLAAALQLPLNKPLVLLDNREFLKTIEARVAVNYTDVTDADLRLAKAQLETDKANQSAAKAAFLPTVSGTANYGRSGAASDNGSNTYFVGVQATVPIWEGGSAQANLKEAKAKVREDEANVKDAAQQQEVNIAKARAAIVEAGVLRESKIQQRQTAEKSLSIAFHAQEIGTGSSLQVMQAKADSATAEDEYNEAQATWVMSLLDLLHAQGQLRDLVKPDNGEGE